MGKNILGWFFRIAKLKKSHNLFLCFHFPSAFQMYHWWHAAAQDRALLRSFTLVLHLKYRHMPQDCARADRRRRVSPRLGCSNCLCLKVYYASRDTLYRCSRFYMRTVTRPSIQTRWSRSFAPGNHAVWHLNSEHMYANLSWPQCLPFWLRA